MFSNERMPSARPLSSPRRSRSRAEHTREACSCSLQACGEGRGLCKSCELQQFQLTRYPSKKKKLFTATTASESEPLTTQWANATESTITKEIQFFSPTTTIHPFR